MTQDHDKKLFLLDAFALIYRAFFAFSKNPRRTSTGFNTSAIFGFTNTLIDLLEGEKPTHIAVVFDSAEQTDRQAEFAFYKAQREAMPEDIASAIPYIKDIIRAFEIPIIEKAGYEADDLIGALAKKAESDGYIVYMVTPDKDFGQLVTENIRIYKPAYMGKPAEILGPEEIKKRWEIVDPLQVIDILGLMGDQSDNIPGIKGVGEKTAIKLIREFGSVENLLQNAESLTGSLKDKVAKGKEMALVSKKLATIITDIPLDIEEKDLVITGIQKEKLEAIFSELEFRTLGKRIFGNTFSVNQTGQLNLFEDADFQEPGAAVTVSKPVGKDIGNTPHEYHLLEAPEQQGQILRQLLQASQVCLDTETTGLNPLTCELVGLAFSITPGEGFYIPFPSDREETIQILSRFQPLFDKQDVTIIGQNIKFDIQVLANYGFTLRGKLFDTMIAHYLIDPESRHNMDILAETHLGYTPVSIESLIGKKGKTQGSMRDVPVEEVKEYAVEDVDITLQLAGVFSPILKEKEMEPLFYDLEMPLVRVLADMEMEGVALDTDFLAQYSFDLEQEIKIVSGAIFQEAGVMFNLDSPKQLGDVLFKRMGIPYEGKKTKTGQFSTNEETLSSLEAAHPVVGKILDYRELVKLKSTYVDALPLLVNPKTDRIHSSFNQAVAATGRLSSQNPNLQNIPIRTERGRAIRKAFIPRDENHVLFSADYSQIELRILAHFSRDKAMLEAFENGQDIHAATASKVYGIPLDEVTKEMRRRAKTVNFGIVYGISAFGLSQRLGISRTEAKDLIDNYFRQYPGIKTYMDSSIEFARQHNFVKTIMGRRRYLPDIQSRNNTVRGFAERNAINSPIQGSAADMIKLAMIRVHKKLAEKQLKSKLTLQVHDELVLDVYKPELDQVREMVIEQMQNAIPLNVPIVVDCGAGTNWLEAH